MRTVPCSASIGAIVSRTITFLRWRTVVRVKEGQAAIKMSSKPITDTLRGTSSPRSKKAIHCAPRADVVDAEDRVRPVGAQHQPLHRLAVASVGVFAVFLPRRLKGTSKNIASSPPSVRILGVCGMIWGL